MTRLDKYIFRQGSVPFLLILLCTTAVIWLTQVLQRLDLMVEDGGSLMTFIKVTILLIPSLVGIITPFALLGAVLYALNLLASDNELPVLGAAGASRIRIARPLIVLSMIASAVVLVINLDLQPRSYRVMKQTIESVRSDVAKAFIRSGIFSEVMQGVTVYAEKVQPGDQYIGLLIHDARDPADPITYTAERGLFQVSSSGPRLYLLRGTIQRIDAKSGNVEILRFIETAIDMASFKEPSGAREIEGTERYVSELLHPDMSVDYDRRRAGRLIAEGHSRLATPLYPLALGLMAMAVMLTAPTSRRGYGPRVMMALGGAIFIRTGGYILQNAGASTPAANIMQYLWPIMVIIAGMVVLIGYFWRVQRRPPIDPLHRAPLAGATP